MRKNKLICNLVEHMSFIYLDGKITIRCIQWHGNNVPKDIKNFQRKSTYRNNCWEKDELFLDLPESEMPQNENDLQDPQVWMDAVCEKFKVDIKMDIDESIGMMNQSPKKIFLIK